MKLCLVALLALACQDVVPCSAADLTHGPLAVHNTKCAADRQARFPNISDQACMADLSCAELLNACDTWVDQRCR